MNAPVRDVPGAFSCAVFGLGVLGVGSLAIWAYSGDASGHPSDQLLAAEYTLLVGFGMAPIGAAIGLVGLVVRPRWSLASMPRKSLVGLLCNLCLLALVLLLYARWQVTGPG